MKIFVDSFLIYYFLILIILTSACIGYCYCEHFLSIDKGFRETKTQDFVETFSPFVKGMSLHFSFFNVCNFI